MTTVLITFLVIFIAIFIMAIGLIFNNKELKGSCGGISEDCSCSAIEKKLCNLKIINNS
tara:strand:- start:97 stop:273 length:177 start_codon:yes stop_codon:yes gene_type:complete